MTRVTVLRPEPGASATVARARARGLDAIAVPLFEIEAVPWEPPDVGEFDGLLLTSANAVRFGGDVFGQLRGLPVHAVGPATAQAAHDAGFSVASTGETGIDELLDSLPASLNLLHPCGEHRTEAAHARQRIVPIVVYRSKERPGPDLARIAGTVALIHSPRAGRRLAELTHRAERSSIAIAAISPAAAEAAGGGWKAVAAAESPADDALLALAARLCNKPPTK